MEGQINVFAIIMLALGYIFHTTSAMGLCKFEAMFPGATDGCFSKKVHTDPNEPGVSSHVSERVPEDATEVTMAVTANSPSNISYYERGYIFDSINQTLFVCSQDQLWNDTACSYTNDFGYSWKELDSSVCNINYIDGENGVLYGLSCNSFLMSSEDLGLTWHHIREDYFTAVLADRYPSLVKATVVPRPEREETSELDLMVIESGYAENDCGLYCSNSSRSLCYNRFGTNVYNDPDVVISASSVWNNDSSHGTGRAELFMTNVGGASAWAVDDNDINQWIQVDFGYPRYVTGVLLRGRGMGGYDQWVKSFRVLYSNDMKIFHSTQTFVGTSDRETIRVRYFDQPIFARYVRINPLSWRENISLRFDLIGCNGWF